MTEQAKAPRSELEVVSDRIAEAMRGCGWTGTSDDIKLRTIAELAWAFGFELSFRAERITDDAVKP